MIAILNTNIYKYCSGELNIDKTENSFPEVNTCFSVICAEYLEKDNVCLSFRGSLYNHNHLIEMLDISPQTSHLELIVFIYLKYGIEQTLRLLVGDYSFFLLDINIKHNHSILYVIQNPMGTVPLYRFSVCSGRNTYGNMGEVYAFSGQLSSKNKLFAYSPQNGNNKTEYIQGGTYQTYHLSVGVSPKWRFVSSKKYFTLPIYSSSLYTSHQNETQISHQLCAILNDIMLSMIMTHKNTQMAIINSGDIGSKVVAEVARQICEILRISPPKVFSLVIHKTDEYSTQQVNAENQNHEYVHISRKMLCEHLSQIVEDAESQDLNAVVYSVSHYFIAKHIKKYHPEIGCVFHNVGDRELFGKNTLYANTTNPVKYDMDMCSYVENMMRNNAKSIYNVLAKQKLRLFAPFLQHSLVCYIMSICPFIRNCLLNSGDMYLLFEVANYLNPHIDGKCENRETQIERIIASCVQGNLKKQLEDIFAEKYGNEEIALLNPVCESENIFL